MNSADKTLCDKEPLHDLQSDQSHQEASTKIDLENVANSDSTVECN